MPPSPVLYDLLLCAGHGAISTVSAATGRRHRYRAPTRFGSYQSLLLPCQKAGVEDGGETRIASWAFPRHAGEWRERPSTPKSWFVNRGWRRRQAEELFIIVGIDHSSNLGSALNQNQIVAGADDGFFPLGCHERISEDFPLPKVGRCVAGAD